MFSVYIELDTYLSFLFTANSFFGGDSERGDNRVEESTRRSDSGVDAGERNIKSADSRQI